MHVPPCGSTARRVLALPMAVALAFVPLFAPLSANAQAVSVIVEGTPTLSATNSGTVTLNGNIFSPNITGTNNSVSLVAQGAVVNYDAQGEVSSITDGSTGNVSVTVSGAKWNASNSGGTDVKGVISDLSQPALAGNATISAVGLQTGIVINTKGKN